MLSVSFCKHTWIHELNDIVLWQFTHNSPIVSADELTNSFETLSLSASLSFVMLWESSKQWGYNEPCQLQYITWNISMPTSIRFLRGISVDFKPLCSTARTWSYHHSKLQCQKSIKRSGFCALFVALGCPNHCSQNICLYLPLQVFPCKLIFRLPFMFLAPDAAYLLLSLVFVTFFVSCRPIYFDQRLLLSNDYCCCCIKCAFAVI